MKSRYYNKVEDLGDFVKKSSGNVKKLKEEMAFYFNLPKSLADHFPKIQHYGGSGNVDFFYCMQKIEGNTASDDFINNFYLSKSCPDELLTAAFSFLNKRPRASQSSEDSCNFLYIDKVKSRHNAFKDSDIYYKMIKSPVYSSFIWKYNDLYDAYINLINRMFVPSDYVVYQHGDFCLTNMFMTNSGLKLIDPMGYDEKYRNMHDPLYDVAKLSHSILGNYDRIINDHFDIVLKDGDFDFALKIIGQDTYMKQDFKIRLNAQNIDYDQVRIREASLFLSMLSLHPESPRRIAAFILQADLIIKELEKKYGVV